MHVQDFTVAVLLSYTRFGIVTCICIARLTDCDFKAPPYSVLHNPRIKMINCFILLSTRMPWQQLEPRLPGRNKNK